MAAQSEPTTKAINIRIPSGLLDLIDGAAKSAGLDRSSYIRLACSEKLGSTREAAAHPSKDERLLSEIQTADPRARAIIRDLLLRVERLETSVFNDAKEDPFA